MSEILSASQIVMAVLEDFGESEPNSVLVVYTNQAGDKVIASNMGGFERIGAARWVEQRTLERLKGD